VSGHALRLRLRRAQPLLGTLVEIGVLATGGDAAHEALDSAFATIRLAQRCLSRFDPGSDLSRFHSLRRGERVAVHPATCEVLVAAHELQTASSGLFDISLGSAPEGWALRGCDLYKLSDDVRLDLGGIGKGHAVDLAVQALLDLGFDTGWVNAGGDLRCFGDVQTAVHLRDEDEGGVRAFATVRDGALATSAFGPGRRAQLAAAPSQRGPAAHVSVAAPRCLWADALTKIVAGSGDASHPMLARYAACAWLHRRDA
jgi:FAD:protein FMN transferase